MLQMPCALQMFSSKMLHVPIRWHCVASKWCKIQWTCKDPVKYRCLLQTAANMLQVRDESVNQGAQCQLQISAQNGIFIPADSQTRCKYASRCNGKVLAPKCSKQCPNIKCKTFPATPWFAHTQTTHPNNMIYLSPEGEWKHWLYAVSLTLSFQDLGF